LNKGIFSTELERFDEQKKRNRRLWNISENIASILYSLVLASSPKRILEIGTSNGYSTFWLSLAAEKVDSFIDTIEVDESRFSMAIQNLKNRKNIRQYLGKAEEVIPTLNNMYDYFFIDAGKINYIDYLNILISTNKINENALIIADNITSHPETVKKYVDFLNSSEDFATVEIPIDSGLLIAKYLPSNRINRSE